MKYTFAGINTGTGQISPSSMIVFKFPAGMHNLNSVGLHSTTTASCYTSGVVQAIANYVIYTQATTPATPCKGSNL
jgi:hypothetical protein